MDHGARVNVFDEDAWAPLHLSARDGYPDIVTVNATSTMGRLSETDNRRLFWITAL